MNINTRADSDNLPEGMESSPGSGGAAGTSFTEPLPDRQPVGDALPLDGSLTTADTEPLDQTGLHPEVDRLLAGSEATSTAAATHDTGPSSNQATGKGVQRPGSTSNGGS